VDAARDIGFALTVRPFLSVAAPKQSVWIDANRCRVAGFDFDLAQGGGARVISGTIPADCVDADGKIVLRINTDRVRSPKELGLSDDTRRLGVGIEKVIIRQM
jgi:hypothetical protein